MKRDMTTAKSTEQLDAQSKSYALEYIVCVTDSFP